MNGPISWLVGTVLGLYLWVVIIDAILSWLVHFGVVNTQNKFVATLWDFCGRLTAPVLGPIRKVLPPIGGVDISPLALWVGIGFAQRWVVPLIPF